MNDYVESTYKRDEEFIEQAKKQNSKIVSFRGVNHDYMANKYDINGHFKPNPRDLFDNTFRTSSRGKDLNDFPEDKVITLINYILMETIQELSNQ